MRSVVKNLHLIIDHRPSIHSSIIQPSLESLSISFLFLLSPPLTLNFIHLYTSIPQKDQPNNKQEKKSKFFEEKEGIQLQPAPSQISHPIPNKKASTYIHHKTNKQRASPIQYVPKSP